MVDGRCVAMCSLTKYSDPETYSCLDCDYSCSSVGCGSPESKEDCYTAG